jgi:hypothetical protein
VPSHAQISIDFDEAVVGIGPTSVQLRRPDGTLVDGSLSLSADRRHVTLAPTHPLPTGRHLTLTLTDAVRDRAGNSAAPASWSFGTAPGLSFDPPRTLWIEAGQQRGYRIAALGALTGVKVATLNAGVNAPAGQRSTLPNLPGRWLHVEAGTWGGHWMRESALVHLEGRSERHRYEPDATIRLRKGVHAGFKFSGGVVVGKKVLELAADTTASVNMRAIINGRRYLHVVSGAWRGYWLPESPAAYLPGAVARIGFSAVPQIRLNGGTYVGRRYDADGKVIGSVRRTVADGTLVTVDAWAIVNGAPRYRAASGAFAGTWLAETSAIRLHVR